MWCYTYIMHMLSVWNNSRRLDMWPRPWQIYNLPLSDLLKACIFLLGVSHTYNRPWVKEREKKKQKLTYWLITTATHMDLKESKIKEIRPYDPQLNGIYMLILQYRWIWMDRTVWCLSIHPNSALCSSHSGQCSMLKSWGKRRWREGTRDETKKKHNKNKNRWRCKLKTVSSGRKKRKWKEKKSKLANSWDSKTEQKERMKRWREGINEKRKNKNIKEEEKMERKTWRKETKTDRKKRAEGALSAIIRVHSRKVIRGQNSESLCNRRRLDDGKRGDDQSDVRIGQWGRGQWISGLSIGETDRQTGSILVLPAEGDLSTSGQAWGMF